MANVQVFQMSDKVNVKVAKVRHRDSCSVFKTGAGVMLKIDTIKNDPRGHFSTLKSFRPSTDDRGSFFNSLESLFKVEN